VVDGSDADPAAQMSASAKCWPRSAPADVPEIVVINKADAADPVEVKGLEAKSGRAWWSPPGPGSGIEDCSPPWTPGCRRATGGPCARALRPGDLVARAHQEGEVLAVRHAADGTELTARVPPGLAAELAGAAGTRRGRRKSNRLAPARIIGGLIIRRAATCRMTGPAGMSPG
jgi:GTP-binding protein HflX